MEDYENPPNALVPIVIKGNDPRLILAIMEYARDVFERKLYGSAMGFPVFHDGDGCSFGFTIDINDGGLRMLAKGVGIKLPELRSAND